MPWRGAQTKGEFPTLGYLVADWIEAKCVIPDGEHQGEPFLLTDEMVRFLLHHYRLRPDADEDLWKQAFHYRRSQLVRPQKWGKGPFSAALICAEADENDAPVVFAGWDADGEPVGRPWITPWVQVTAVSEDQTDNVWRALLPMIELGDLAGDFDDTGLTRINLPGGGRIEPTTASGRSRLGQRITFAVQDETHSWLKRNGGHTLADTQRRNLAGMGGRSVETTNGWDPSEQSVAQLTADAELKDVFVDHRRAGPTLQFGRKRDRQKIFRHVYGDSWWVDVERIEAEAQELIARGEVAQAARFFGNMIEVTESAWLAPDAWAACAKPGLGPVKRSEKICLGFDGSDSDDATALVGCRLRDGFVWTIGIWERPDGPAGEGWQVPRAEVDAAVAQAFKTWRPVRFYADPPFWQDEVAGWASEFGERRVKEWWTNRDRPMVAALERVETAVKAGQFAHDGDARLARHVRNARRRQGRAGYTIGKDRPGSPAKIDAAMAMVLAYEARADAVTAGQNRRAGGGGA